MAEKIAETMNKKKVLCVIPVTDAHKAKIEERTAGYQFIYKNAKDADIFIENPQNYKEDRPLRNLVKF